MLDKRKGKKQYHIIKEPSSFVALDIFNCFDLQIVFHLYDLAVIGIKEIDQDLWFI